MLKGYVFEVRGNGKHSYIFAQTPKGARDIFKELVAPKVISVEKRSKKVEADSVKDTCINL